MHAANADVECTQPLHGCTRMDTMHACAPDPTGLLLGPPHLADACTLTLLCAQRGCGASRLGCSRCGEGRRRRLVLHIWQTRRPFTSRAPTGGRAHSHTYTLARTHSGARAVPAQWLWVSPERLGGLPERWLWGPPPPYTWQGAPGGVWPDVRGRAMRPRQRSWTGAVRKSMACRRCLATDPKPAGYAPGRGPRCSRARARLPAPASVVPAAVSARRPSSPTRLPRLPR